MDKRYKDAKKKLDEAVGKQHDYRKLPRMRCVAKMAGEERIEFILPEGTNPATFCKGWKELSINQLIFPQTQPEIKSILVNFGAVSLIFVSPEPASEI